jgi:hypothetical protein
MLGVIGPEALIPANHPIRRIKPPAGAAVRDLEPTFEGMYAQIGRPSIPFLLLAPQPFFADSVPSLQWFLDLNLEDEPFDHSSCAKNRRRLLEHRVSRQFFEAVVQQARRRHLPSSPHFTVDGTLLESGASMKSCGPGSPRRSRTVPVDRARAIPRSTSRASDGATRPTSRRLILTR